METNINTVNKTPLRNTVTSKCRIRLPWLPWPLPRVPLPGLPFFQNQSKPGWRMTTNRPRSVAVSVMDGRSVRRQPVCATHSGSPFNRSATGVAQQRSRTPTHLPSSSTAAPAATAASISCTASCWVDGQSAAAAPTRDENRYCAPSGAVREFQAPAMSCSATPSCNHLTPVLLIHGLVRRADW